jgi:hypothetical protein
VIRRTPRLRDVEGLGPRSAAKLEGTRYAASARHSSPVIQTVITCDGGPASGIQNITTNVFGVDAQAHQADFVWIFQGWWCCRPAADVELNAMSPLDYCVPNYYTRS